MSYLEELLPEFRKGAKIRRSIWDNKEIFVKINEMGEPVLNNGNKFEFFRNITCSDWEFYQEPIDWDHIIKNKCLCWFWDDGNNENFIARLEAFNMDDDNMRFKSKNGAAWRNCRPVSRDEVTFYEDKKDETDGLLSIATLCTSNLAKGVVKSIKKAGDNLDD